MKVDEFIHTASVVDVREFLQFCADTRVFPSDTALKAYNLRCEWGAVNVKTAKWLIDNKALKPITELIAHVRDLILEINEDDERSYRSANNLSNWIDAYLKNDEEEKPL